MRRCKEPGSTNARPMPYQIVTALSMPWHTCLTFDNCKRRSY